MMVDNATNFYRKSGVAQWRDLRFLLLLTQTLQAPIQPLLNRLIFVSLMRASGMRASGPSNIMGL